VGLRDETAELAVVSRDWPRDQYGLEAGDDGPRFELFVYVDDVDVLVEDLRGAGTAVLREPAVMPWGERIGFVTDPDGNPVALAAETAPL
jgi:lactoylglutathione lyase